MAERKNTKKVVRAESAPKKERTGSAKEGREAPVWRPTEEGLAKAKRLRIFAGISWAVAIALELFAIIGLLHPERRARVGVAMGWDAGDEGFPNWALIALIVLFVVIGILAILGSQLWKRANDLDPASEKDRARYFIQNQLGAFITVLAFIPLIVLILANKDMSKQQKTIATAAGGAIAVVAILLGVDWSPTSIEQRTVEAQWDQQRVIAITGQDQVYWVPGGSVYHLCAEVSPLQEGSTSEEILTGTVQDAIDGGMERLTKQVQMEVNQCGLPQPDDIYLEWAPPENFEDLAPADEEVPAVELEDANA